MNTAYESLLTRRSVRKYKPEQITDAELEAVLKAGTYAPTAMGKQSPLIIAVQPTRGLDVGAIENIHGQLVSERDKDKAILLVSLELDEVMSLSDRILVMYEGEIVGELDPKKTTQEELGLYMAGAKRDEVTA